MTPYEVDRLRCDDAKTLLAELIEKLDELDAVDYFGNEGWRQMLLGE